MQWPIIDHVDISGERGTIYGAYITAFYKLFGIEPWLADMIGHLGEKIAEAEYKAIGTLSYTNSISVCMRNAFYATMLVKDRFKKLNEIGIEPPVLDYGCGVGVLCKYMESHGISPCYGYDLEGLQTKVAREVGVRMWDKEPVKTVVCINVLEHVADPESLLDRLYSISGRVLANTCMGHKSEHVASEDSLSRCRERLIKKNGLIN